MADTIYKFIMNYGYDYDPKEYYFSCYEYWRRWFEEVKLIELNTSKNKQIIFPEVFEKEYVDRVKYANNAPDGCNFIMELEIIKIDKEYFNMFLDTKKMQAELEKCL